MALPLLFQRLVNDPTCTSFEHLHNQLLQTAVPNNELINRITELMELKNIIQQTIDNYMEDISEKMHLGHEVAGFKLKAGRTNRTISDEATAARLLHAIGIPKSELYVEKLVGIPAIEKQLKALGKSKNEIDVILSGFITSTTSAATATFA